MKAYKFMNRTFADSFAAGVVRISPAFSFRIDDGIDDGRNDFNELIHETDLSDSDRGSVEVTLDPSHPMYPHGMFIEVVGGVRREMTIIATASEQRDIMQGLLFCCSCSATDSMSERMAKTFGADALFEILDIDMFAEILSSHWFLLERMTHKGRVLYMESSARRGAHIPPSPLLKDQAFEWQDEYRIVWSQYDEHEAFNIQIPEIIGLLHRVF
jgi:hypothetical protein